MHKGQARAILKLLTLRNCLYVKRYEPGKDKRRGGLEDEERKRQGKGPREEVREGMQGKGKKTKALNRKKNEVEAVFLFLQDMQNREILCLPRPFLLRTCTRIRSTGVSKIDTSEGAIFAFIFPSFYSCTLFSVSLLFSGGASSSFGSSL